MRVDVDDDIAVLRDWYAANSTQPGAADIARGAVWMLARVSGLPQEQVERLAGIAQPKPVAAVDAPLGWYAGIGPITRTARDPRPADMSQPVPPGKAIAVDLENGNRIVKLDGSFAERAARAKADGDPAAAPLDAETRAEVDAMFSHLRQRNSAS